jgi:hypothetical protein
MSTSVQSISVRSIFAFKDFRSPEGWTLYEERIVVVKAPDFEAAFSAAEIEAGQYATDAGAFEHKVSDAFELFDEVVEDGVEVWSTMRDSPLSLNDYERQFCVSARDRRKGDTVSPTNLQ